MSHIRIMIQPYLVYINQIYKAIYLGLWKMLGFQEQSLKKNKRSPDRLKECEVQILSKVLHVKSLSPLVKDDGSYILYFINVMLGLGVRYY